MNTIFQTTITQIGGSARDALFDDMLITFREGAPADIEEFCFIHQHGNTLGELRAGGWMELADQRYPITAVGNVASQNLRELGHLTVRFDGETQAEFPGSIHVSGTTPIDIPIGSTLKFIA
ncbi:MULTISPECIES: PTS glucitol/sorbitol transporter subunit IIA [Serratia]|jgi:PTS system glucitol/sorbitol-specific IIA component|uniref:PTS glucitol/sorbitol transporter subunit IIA n=1 Tax=Serratia grimesii TaxID=82995 RepID=A0A7G2JRI3_9GAMM|nr:PTS glucitol/sorbitol transporter subunit IIA [Serratia grimesii]KFB89657.1 PTS system glucitol/sorbitol-specific transporter subunit IIA [Serratia grimesii]CAI1100837.1 PTS system glucitol/sorbitol-specific transporter subunit IIA [Serratia grimesii]CAI1108156.1 PTS system glucitol/sorbitol-specific transporter subunit IIA [Serratia grimesii]CAI2511665.1 PTS system glucitol/sorbitol-specific transporter subunit IIA [Serratia grimesii]CAI2788075.1 PTS system glucitol/sorbitol-specific trans